MPIDPLVIKTKTLTGAEYITLSSDNSIVKVSDIKNFVLQGILQEVGLNQVDNTTDQLKPLSISQRKYIDSRLLAVENKIEQLVTLMTRYVDTQGKL